MFLNKETRLCMKLKVVDWIGNLNLMKCIFRHDWKPKGFLCVSGDQSFYEMGKICKRCDARVIWDAVQHSFVKLDQHPAEFIKETTDIDGPIPVR